MSRMTFAFILLLICGCGPFVTTPDSSRPSPGISDEHPTAADIWYVLAVSVDRGSISTSQRLAQFVVVLARFGELSAEDVAAFDGAFPDAATSDRPLNADDAKQLRGIPF
jgi:hypothetical protein